MTTGYRIAAAGVLLILGLSLAASYYGWGLQDDATLRAQSVRQGGPRGRYFLGGGPGGGK